MADTRIQELVINELTKAQYDAAEKDPNQLYFVKDGYPNYIGDLSSLQTTAKDNLVNAINEVAQGGGGEWDEGTSFIIPLGTSEIVLDNLDCKSIILTSPNESSGNEDVSVDIYINGMQIFRSLTTFSRVNPGKIYIRLLIENGVLHYVYHGRDSVKIFPSAGISQTCHEAAIPYSPNTSKIQYGTIDAIYEAGSFRPIPLDGIHSVKFVMSSASTKNNNYTLYKYE